VVLLTIDFANWAWPCESTGSSEATQPSSSSGGARRLNKFYAVLAWSCYRFVRFASYETLKTTLALLAECFEELGAVPAVVLSDRMGCLKNGIFANLVVPDPDYLRFAAHFGFRVKTGTQRAFKLAGFPVRKVLEEFKVQLSSVPQAR
jgi:transposase